jgi:hypothetical protein
VSNTTEILGRCLEPLPLLPRGNSENRFSMGNARPEPAPGCSGGNTLLPNRCLIEQEKPRQNRGFWLSRAVQEEYRYGDSNPGFRTENPAS